MLTEQQAVAMLERHGMSGTRLAHSRAVAAFAFDLARRIHRTHPALPLDPHKVRIGALLHDIGRTRPGAHVPNSIAILREEGLDELAQIVAHGSCYEQMKLRGVDDPSLLPRTLENRIVAYADARVRLKPMPLEERIGDIRRRHGKNQEKLRAVEMALPRYRHLEHSLMELAR